MSWKKNPLPPTPPTPTMRAIGVIVCDTAGENVPDADVSFQDTATTWQHGVTDDGGYILFPAVPVSLANTQLRVEAVNYLVFDESIVLTTDIDQQVWLGGTPSQPTALQLPALVPAHFDPSFLTLEQLAKIRGSMWTARCNVPYGPRPNQDSNILALNYYHLYGAEDRKKMLTAYKARGYTHGVCSVPIDEGGYHHMWPSQPGPLTQERWDTFLDSVQERWDAGIASVFFAIPDELQDYPERWGELEPFFLQERAQKLLRIAILAWEPLKESAWWVNGAQWLTRMFPKALRGLHFTPDHDAPGIGGEAENDELWRRVAAYLHIFPHQSKEFEQGEAGLQSWLQNWDPTVNGSYPSRFNDGYANWPTTSAWGYRGILAFPAEYLAYWCTNANEPESTAVHWGDEAMRVGAPAYLDGGSS